LLDREFVSTDCELGTRPEVDYVLPAIEIHAVVPADDRFNGIEQLSHLGIPCAVLLLQPGQRSGEFVLRLFGPFSLLPRQLLSFQSPFSLLPCQLLSFQCACGFFLGTHERDA